MAACSNQVAGRTGERRARALQGMHRWLTTEELDLWLSLPTTMAPDPWAWASKRTWEKQSRRYRWELHEWRLSVAQASSYAVRSLGAAKTNPKQFLGFPLGNASEVLDAVRSLGGAKKNPSNFLGIPRNTSEVLENSFQHR
jgi:hypothetical protein